MLDMLDWAWLAPRQTVSQSHSLTVPLRNREGGPDRDVSGGTIGGLIGGAHNSVVAS
jgi:hypothetical protein